MANGLDIRLELTPRDAASGRFLKISDNLLSYSRDVVAQQTLALVSQVRSNIGATFHNPGQMQTAVGFRIYQRGSQWVGEVDASGELTGRVLPFMRIQEYGGVAQTPAIFPKKARVLHFMTKTGQEVFAKRTKPHPTRIPPRSYFRMALEQRQAEIQQAFNAAVTRAVNE